MPTLISTPTFIGAFLLLFIATETGMNTLWRRNKIYNFTITVYPTLHDKTKATQMAHFEANCHSILLLTVRMSL